MINYGNDLYHWGIKGMHWGIRRYQNTDGSLTAEGRIRYGSGQESGLKRTAKKVGKGLAVGAKTVGKGVGKGAKTIGSKIARNYRIKHPKNPKKMTDEELQERIKRLEMEARVKDLEKRNAPEISRGRKVVGDILENGAKTMGNAAFQALAKDVFEKKEKEADDNSYSSMYAKTVLGDRHFLSNDELEKAVQRYNNLRILEGKQPSGGGKKKK